MRSASLLTYKADDNALVEIARDVNAAWLTSIAMLSENTFLCADDAHNMFTLQRRTASSPSDNAGYPALTQEDLNSRLESVGQMHMGEFVNQMHRASLVEHPVSVVDSGSSGGKASDD